MDVLEKNNCLTIHGLLITMVAGMAWWMLMASVVRAEQIPITFTAKVVNVQVAKDDEREAWTFGGGMPGPVIRVKEGDVVNFTLKNEADRVHSIDFHAAKTPWDKHFQGIANGMETTFTWKADYPGIFYYHCGTDPMIQHIANGMFGAIIVEPKQAMVKPDREYVIVQSEIYPSAFDVDAMMEGRPKFVVFNGRANRYVDEPLEARPGERIRLYVVNAGPNHFSAFHVIGGIFDQVYESGNPKNVLHGVQTHTIAPGGAAILDLVVPVEGLYPIVTHSLSDALTGALGLINVSNTVQQPMANDQEDKITHMRPVSLPIEATVEDTARLKNEACSWMQHGHGRGC